MDVIADLHVHSRFSRACSKNLSLTNLEKYARLKGVTVLGTGDFQHPLWQKELKNELSDDGTGVLRTAGGFPFILQTEISTMFRQGGKGRRIHSVVLVPDWETADQVTEMLGKRGRLDYDGRPIFGFSCAELVSMMRNISRHIEVIPAHVWTSWFGVFGSKSGFDSLKECFQEQTKHVHAIETGLSSDPSMNWRLSALDGIQLVSFSDLHSFWPHRLGREATVFDVDELNYMNILNAIRTGDGLKETIEFFPEEGKYHWDGHRNCGVMMSPEESEKINSVCAVCRRELTIGVEHRVRELADRPEGYRPATAKPFKRLIPLSEIIAIVLGTQPFSKRVWGDYYTLVKAFGNEFAVLLRAGKQELEDAAGAPIAKAIIDVREGRVRVMPGYDGVYGEPVFGGDARRKERAPVPGNRNAAAGQKTLGDF